jgi:pyridoxine 4-dehydrogenase
MTTTDPSTRPITASGTFTLGENVVHRLGFGAMRLTGQGVWGEPADRDECVRTVRRAIDLGVDLIDTADSYGPEVSENIIFEALHPYPEHLVIATKAGLARIGPGQWLPLGRPEYLRQQCEMSLRRLGLEQIDLFQLHRIDPKVPAEDQFGALAQLVEEGKAVSVGLSQVGVEEIKAAQAVIPIASVQNRYNLTDQSSADVLEYCTAEGLGFIPWFPMAAGGLANEGGPVDAIVRETGATPAQIALAWILHKSPVTLPIPGTKSVAHVEQNCAAATVRLSAEQLAALDRAVG